MKRVDDQQPATPLEVPLPWRLEGGPGSGWGHNIAIVGGEGGGQNCVIHTWETPERRQMLEFIIAACNASATRSESAPIINPAYPSFKAMERDAIDAARYRFIRSEASHSVNGAWSAIMAPDCNDEKMDAAIDAAMEPCK